MSPFLLFYLPLSLSVCLAVFLTFRLPVCLPVCPLCLCMSVSVCLTAYLSLCLSIYLSIGCTCLSFCHYLYLYVNPNGWFSACLLSFYLTFYFPKDLSVFFDEILFVIYLYAHNCLSVFLNCVHRNSFFVCVS